MYDGQMRLLAPLAALLALAPAPAGWFESPAGYGLRPPPGFVLDAKLPTGRTGAAGPAPAGAVARVDAAFSDLAAGGSSSLFVSVVDAPLPATAAEPERLAALALDYAKELLDAKLRLEWVDRVPSAGVKVVEVAGRLRVAGEERVAQFAFVPDGDRYLVLVASLPPARFADQGPEVEASLASLRLARPLARPAFSRAEIGALVGAGLGLAVALGFRRRRARLPG